MGTEAEAIAKLQKDSVQVPHIVTVGEADVNGVKDVQVLVLPTADGAWDAHDIKHFVEPYRSAPERIRGTATLHELDDFIKHVERFKVESTSVFVDRNPSTPSMLAVYDYHNNQEPDFCVHRAVYPFPLADQWVAWTKQSGKSMGQAEFAAWLEEHLADVADPTLAGETAKAFAGLFDCRFAGHSKLLELSRGLAVHVDERVVQAVNLASGEGSIQYDTSHKDDKGAPMKVPGAFLLGLPVFRGGELYQVPVRLRYRTSGGGISWSFSLHRADAVFDDAIKGAVLSVMDDCEGVQVFYGAPEK
jgi:uncharacterized protein YfdQ (DUF2303 family)